MDFLIAREELSSWRFSDSPAPQPEDGQALLTVERFGLSANNITYAAFGEQMSYWSFFPAPPGWGRMPVWGFAEVASSRSEAAVEGSRVYGYLPPSSELIVQPAPVAGGFIDAAAHRAALPAAYNSYLRVEEDPLYEADTEEHQMLLRPLFATSWLLDDLLEDAGLLGAATVIVSSASSKTASALAYLLSRRGVDVVGLSSERGAGLARSLGVYADVIAYGEPEALPAGRAVYVDFAGDAAVRADVHGRYGEQLVHSAVVGATHHDRLGAVPDDLPGPRPRFFFAPERVSRRSRDWGRDGFVRRLTEAWAPYVAWSRGWLEIASGTGPEALETAYRELLAGRSDPRRGHVLSLGPV